MTGRIDPGMALIVAAFVAVAVVAALTLVGAA